MSWIYREKQLTTKLLRNNAIIVPEEQVIDAIDMIQHKCYYISLICLDESKKGEAKKKYKYSYLTEKFQLSIYSTSKLCRKNNYFIEVCQVILLMAFRVH